MDWNCIIYMALIGFLLFFFHETVQNWPLHILIHAGFIIGIIEIIRVSEKKSGHQFLWFMRTFYPLAIIFYGWNELDALVPMIFGSYWATDFIVNLDQWIFGVHPTIWVQNLFTPWLDELMNFFYAGYYTLFLFVPLSLYMLKKRKAAIAIFSLATLTYLSNYLIFYILPVLGPKSLYMFQNMQINEQTGFLFTELNRFIQSNGGIKGGAFPSSHVAGAIVWALCALKYNRKLGILLSPIAIGIAFSRVYMGLHHAVDPIAGILWGILCYIIGLKIIRSRGEDPLHKSLNTRET